MKNVILFVVLLVLFWGSNLWFDCEIVRRCDPSEDVSVTFKGYAIYFLTNLPFIIIPFIAGFLHKRQHRFYFHVIMVINLFTGVFLASAYTREIWLYCHPEDIDIFMSTPREIPGISMLGATTAFVALVIPLALGVCVRQLKRQKFIQQTKFDFEERAM